MAWVEYLKQMTDMGPKMKAAAIHGHDGSLWATSPNFNLSVEEVNGFQRDGSMLFQTGLRLAGVKYVVLQNNLKDDSNPFMAVKTSGEAELCNGCIYKTKKAFLICIGAPTTPGGAINEIVYKLYDYLTKLDY
ncbi:unnamed protein product [Knipowitschia caucasica]